ncbi:hypothetical protein CY34DRAFT_43588, partial [Suillus luteus UH-Slu-Lm8-n1]
FLTSQAWVYELISGHPNRIRHNFGVNLQICDELLAVLNRHGFIQSQNRLTASEQLGIFLY